ncbi:alpha/beta-hydrolase [Xylaria cf. heliscus]|nr:alpha/beta-hydrolase [Xylaria cf. heliscus]
MSKPVFVLLHGAWHTPRCWDKLISALQEEGCSALAPALPSSGSTPPTPDWSSDVDAIQKAVLGIIKGEGADVVVVAHSFSGLTAGTALHGLDKETSTAKGLKGGVIRLIYINAFLVREGFQHSPQGTRDNMIPEMKTDFKAGTITVSPEDAKEMFYQDMQDENVIATLANDLVPQSLAIYWCTTTHAAWRYIPTTYIKCTADRPSTVAAVDWLINTAKASGMNKIDSVIEVDAGHSPFISKTDWLAKTLVTEANKKG